MQYSYFSAISRFPLKTVHPFRNFLAVFPLPTLYKVETRKKFCLQRVQHCLWGEGRGLDLCELENAPKTQKCPKAFVHDCLKKRWEEKKAVLRVFQACKSVFSRFRLKIVIEQTFSQLLGVF